MGQIHTDVQSNHLAHHPDEIDLLKPFLSGFNITWANTRRSHNSIFSVYFLEPESHIKEAYGFDFEIALIYTPYDTIEPRAIQGSEQFLTESPEKGRVDNVNYFLVSGDPYAEQWVSNYQASRQEPKIIVAFSKKEVLANIHDAYFVRNKLNKQFYGRDLFNYSLPLTEDTYFFGRQSSIAAFLDAIRLSDNRGLFGLRKTGKTSFLLKINRIVSQENLGESFYYDCKNPSLRKLHWNELLGEICDNICSRLKISLSKKYSERDMSKTFNYLINTLGQRNIKIILVFDEIEYISFRSIQDTHWHTEF